MKKNKHIYSPLLLSAFIIFLIAVYYIYIRNLVFLAYQGQAPDWFNSLIETLYPRFEIEKQRFDIAFFLSKADQIIIRFSIIGILINGFLFLLKSEKIKNKFNVFWNSSISTKNVRLLSILFYSLMLIIFKDIYWDMLSLSKAELFYKPILLFKISQISFPSDANILFIYIILIVSCLACMFNIYPVLFSIIAIVDFIFIQGLIFSFEKTDHGFATFTYAGMLMPFLLFERNKVKKTNDQQQGWPLQLIILIISICYLYTGLEKVLISKFEWINPSTFKAYLQIHQAPPGLILAKNEFLCFVLPILTLLFQLGFILIVFYKKLKWIFIPTGIIFHISTYFLFDVGGFFNPWIMVYIFFFDWDQIIQLIKRRVIQKLL